MPKLSNVSYTSSSWFKVQEIEREDQMSTILRVPGREPWCGGISELFGQDVESETLCRGRQGRMEGDLH